jgi:hypothetical protein
MNRLVGSTSVVVLAFLFGAPWPSAAQQQFRADIAMSGGAFDEPTSGVMYFGGNRLRLEVAGAEAMTIIAEPATGRMLFVMESERMYMEMPAGMAPVDASGVRSMDAADPCASGEVTSCERVGEESVNGYATVHWTFERDGLPEEAWIAPQFRFPVRVIDGDGTTMEWSNFQTGAQPASLFEVPAGYTAMSVPAFGGGFPGAGRAGPPAGAGLPPGLAGIQGLDSATIAMIQGFGAAGGVTTPGGRAGGRGGASVDASAWEAVAGWVAEITVDASGSSTDNSESGQSTREYSLHYSGQVPITYGTPAVMGFMGPAWQLVPGLGTPATLAQPMTFTGRVQFREVLTTRVQCPDYDGTRRTTEGAGAAEYSALPDESNMFAMGLAARLELAADLRTYKFGSGLGAPEGSYTAQTDFTTTQLCPESTAVADRTTNTRQPQFGAMIQVEGLPLPAAPGLLTGRRTLPISLDFGGVTETVDATVEWTIRPIS